jgi:phytoene dehydrogenase-like protein
MSKKVIIVGGGHNGMVCALQLAQGGRHVTIVEAHDGLGGLCRGDEFAPGFTSPGALHDDGLMPGALIDALGLDVERTSGPRAEYSPAPGGEGVLLDADPARSKAGEDAKAWAEHRAFMERVGGFLRGVMEHSPPPLSPKGAGDLLNLGGKGLKLRRLGKKDMIELIRVLPMAAGDYVKERFSSERVRALVGGPGCIGTFLGPWSAGSAATMLLREACRGPGVIGGARAIGLALEDKLSGVEVKTAARVTRVVTEQGAVTGVELDGGEVLKADEVVLACDPKHGLLDLLDPFELPLKVSEQVVNIRARGTITKIDLALDADLPFPEGVTRAFVAHELDDVERAFDAVKYQRLPERPFLDVYLASREDKTLAPEGKHVVSVLASFTPYDVEGGWTDEARDQILHNTLAVLDEVAPGVLDNVLHSRVLGPPDIERELHVTGGCLHHVEHSLDQLLFMRPGPKLAEYKTPVGGLFLGSSGTHPGGGVRGLNGALCARAILKG